MKKRIFSLLLVLALLSSLTVLPVQAEEQTLTEAQKGAAIAKAANEMTFPTDYTDYVADCPACGEKQVTWIAVKFNGRVGYNATGHYYCDDITASTHTQFIALDNGGKVCLHLNGQTLSNAGRIAVLGGNSTVNIMGSGTVIGKGTTSGDYKQGTLVAQNASTINLYGGIYKSELADMPVVSVSGNVNAKVNLYADAVIDSSVGHNVDVVVGSFNMYGGEIKNAVTTGSGGNVRLRSSIATFNMYGGTISGGKSSATAAGGNVYLTSGSKLNLYGGTITGGEGTGADSIGGNIYVNNGTVAMSGGQIAQSANPEDSEVFMTAANGAFQIVDGTNTPVTLKGTIGGATAKDGKVYIDVNANTVNVTGTGTLYALDSANDAYALSSGKATVADTVTVEKDVAAPNGNRYIAIGGENGAYSFHRLNMRLTTVSLRTAACGIYYKAKYECDDVLAQKVSSYGVIFSVNNMPGADFATEEGDINRYTVMTPDASFGDGTVATSGSVFNIMKTDSADQNAARGETPIYANAYIVLDGQTFVADGKNAGKKVTDEGFDGAAYSLLDALKAVDRNWNTYVQAGQDSVIKAFYNTWAQYGMDAWADRFDNIA